MLYTEHLCSVECQGRKTGRERKREKEKERKRKREGGLEEEKG